MEQENQEESGGIGGMIQKYISSTSKEDVEKKFQQAGDKMSSQERGSIVQTIFNQLSSKGFDINGIVSQLGLSSSDPNKTSTMDLGKIAGFVREKAPFILPIVAEKFPVIVRHLGLEESGVMGDLGKFLDR